MPPHTFEKRHYHESSKQFFFIIKGTAEIEIDGLFYSLHEQEGIEVESGLPHQLFNNSETDIEFLVCSTPPTTDDPNTSTLTIIFG
jgi:mannose-6-phosphate isomerase-like protein (cupin superfamily)